MDEIEIEKLKTILSNIPEIKLAYLFGSRASATAGPLSDYDFAFYLDCRDQDKMEEIRYLLIDPISQILKTDKVDIVILNLVGSPEMKYDIIRSGKLFFEKEPFKVIVEPNILYEYFDFRSFLERNHLTRS